jgi:DNA replication protein DnaC
MDQLITDRLRDNLERLKLTQAADVLDTVLAQAEAEKTSYMAFLDHLLEEEVAAKEKRRVQTAMKTAGLPAAKTIEEYDFSFHPDLNKKEVMALFDLDFIRKQENVIFLGPPRGWAKRTWPSRWPPRPVITALRSISRPWTF